MSTLTMSISQYTNPNFDLSLLNEIADGSPEFMSETISLFLQQVPELLEEIETAAQLADWDTAGAAAHKLKSTIGMFGMDGSLEIIQKIEHDTKKRENLQQIGAHIGSAKSLIGTVYADLDQIRKNLDKA